MHIRRTSRDVSTEIVLGSIDRADLDDLPASDIIKDAIPFVSPRFRANLLDFRQGGDHFAKLRDGEDGLHWGIFVENKLIGITGLDELDDADGPESYSAILDPQSQGKGYGVYAALARTYHGFAVASIERIRSSIDARNPASLRCVEKLGYVCLEHVATYGYDRHQLVAYHPSRLIREEDIARVPLHQGSWQTAQSDSAAAIERAEKSFTYREII